jgi:hypothetical protein
MIVRETMVASKKSPFSKPGQKYATPEPTDALYKFYTSLYKQTQGESKMAVKWMLEHGTFTKKKAEQIFLESSMDKLSITTNKKIITVPSKYYVGFVPVAQNTKI